MSCILSVPLVTGIVLFHYSIALLWGIEKHYCCAYSMLTIRLPLMHNTFASFNVHNVFSLKKKNFLSLPLSPVSAYPSRSAFCPLWVPIYGYLMVGHRHWVPIGVLSCLPYDLYELLMLSLYILCSYVLYISCTGLSVLAWFVLLEQPKFSVCQPSSPGNDNLLVWIFAVIVETWKILLLVFFFFFNSLLWSITCCLKHC